MNREKNTKPILSILITVFNQSNILRWNLDSILSDDNEDFELVIQDDASNEPVEKLLRSYHDDRIRYYRNPLNYGHDRNIIEGFQNCRSDHVFLLRTSDTILPGGIRKIITGIRKYPDAAYGRFSCVDENGAIRFRYKNRISLNRTDTIRLNEGLWIHPSGELYNKRYLCKKDLMVLSSYLERFFHDKNRFILNEMMRDLLCTRGPFFSSEEIVWIYSRTNKRRDLAYNRNRNGVCIYAPSYMYERFRCELCYLSNEVSGKQEKKESLSHKFDVYARMTVWDFKRINRDPEMQKHYGYREVPFNCISELKNFKKEAYHLADELPEEYGSILRKKARSLSFLNLIAWQAKSLVSNLLVRSLGSALLISGNFSPQANRTS